jgi:hypothetical protein
MKIAYGHTVRSTDDLYVRLAEEAGMGTVTGGSPGSVLVDFFPARMSGLVTLSLKPGTSPDGPFLIVKHIPTWMPGAGFKRHALRTRIKVRTMHDTPYEMVQTAMVSHGSPINTHSLIPYQGGRHSHSFFHIETYIGQPSCWTVTCPRRRGHQGDSRNAVWR